MHEFFVEIIENNNQLCAIFLGGQGVQRNTKLSKILLKLPWLRILASLRVKTLTLSKKEYWLWFQVIVINRVSKNKEKMRDVKMGNVFERQVEWCLDWISDQNIYWFEDIYRSMLKFWTLGT